MEERLEKGYYAGCDLMAETPISFQVALQAGDFLRFQLGIIPASLGHRSEPRLVHTGRLCRASELVVFLFQVTDGLLCLSEPEAQIYVMGAKLVHPRLQDCQFGLMLFPPVIQLRLKVRFVNAKGAANESHTKDTSVV